MMNIPDWRHAEDRKEAERLREEGFEFEVTANGYFVKFKGQGIGGGSVMLPRRTPLRGKQGQNNLRDSLSSAIITAKGSTFFKAIHPQEQA